MSSFRRPVPLKRTLREGYWSQGRYIQGNSEVPTEIQASTQPAPGQETQSLPEGRRNKEAYVLFTDTELFVTDVKLNQVADQVQIGSFWYEVVKCQPFQCGVISHYRALVVGTVQ